MLETQQEEYLFDCGIQYFNANQYESAHKEWEELWKLIGLNTGCITGQLDDPENKLLRA